jgi:ribosomal protein S18 acetylase RimI-like enzyme
MTTNSEANSVSLRLARDEDEEFLRAVYAGTRAEELALVPWDEAQRAAFIRFQFAAQQRFYKSEYPDAQHHVILNHGRPVGRIYVDRRRAQEIRILDIALLPAHRGLGIGTPLITALMSEAAGSAKALSIYVDRDGRAQRLFARLGFVVREESDFQVLMEWRPK